MDGMQQATDLAGMDATLPVDGGTWFTSGADIGTSGWASTFRPHGRSGHTNSSVNGNIDPSADQSVAAVDAVIAAKPKTKHRKPPKKSLNRRIAEYNSQGKTLDPELLKVGGSITTVGVAYSGSHFVRCQDCEI